MNIEDKIHSACIEAKKIMKEIIFRIPAIYGDGTQRCTITPYKVGRKKAVKINIEDATI